MGAQQEILRLVFEKVSDNVSAIVGLPAHAHVAAIILPSRVGLVGWIELSPNQPVTTCRKVIVEPEHSEGLTRNITFSEWNLAQL